MLLRRLFFGSNVIFLKNKNNKTRKQNSENKSYPINPKQKHIKPENKYHQIPKYIKLISI